jgi:hypothetical protein
MQDVLISRGGQARNPETIKQRGFRISMNARTHCAVIIEWVLMSKLLPIEEVGYVRYA